MTLAVLAARKGYLKVLGSFIQAACDRGHHVVLLHDPDEKKPGEAVTAADLALWPRATPRAHRRGEPLLPILKDAGATALVGPSLHFLMKAMGVTAEAGAMRAAGLRLYSVDYVFDMVASEPEGYRVVDITCYLSEHQRAIHWRVQAAELRRHRRRARAAGAQRGGRLHHAGSARPRRPSGGAAEVRAVRVGAHRAVHVAQDGGARALPPPRVGGRLARAARRRRRSPRGTARSSRRFYAATVTSTSRGRCGTSRDASGATFVVKSRAKNADPAFLRRRADLFVERDEDVYPYTSIELVAIADLCVHFQSGAVLEAAHAGVPSLSIRVPQTHLEGYACFQDVFGARSDSLQNFPGIVWSADAAEATRMLRSATLADFRVDPEARGRYVETFLGFDDSRSSERVLDLVEAGAASPRRPLRSSSASLKSMGVSMFTDSSRGIT